MKTCWETEKDGQTYEVVLAKDNIEISTNPKDNEGSLIGLCSYFEFKRGCFQDKVISLFGEKVLQEILSEIALDKDEEN